MRSPHSVWSFWATSLFIRRSTFIEYLCETFSFEIKSIQFKIQKLLSPYKIFTDGQDGRKQTIHLASVHSIPECTHVATECLNVCMHLFSECAHTHTRMHTRTHTHTQFNGQNPNENAIWPTTQYWQNGRLKVCCCSGHWSARCFLALAWAPVMIRHRKRGYTSSHHLQNGHVRN